MSKYSIFQYCWLSSINRKTATILVGQKPYIGTQPSHQSVELPKLCVRQFCMCQPIAALKESHSVQRTFGFELRPRQRRRTATAAAAYRYRRGGVPQLCASAVVTAESQCPKLT